MKKITFILLISIFVIPQVHAQKTVLGTVDYSYKLLGEGAEQMAGMMPNKMIFQYGENGLTMVMQGGMMAASIGKTVVNGETGESFTVKDSEKTVYVMSEEEIKSAAEQASKPEIEKLDETKKILGYNCEKYVQTVTMQGMEIKQTLWVTKELKAPKYEGDAFKSMASQGGMSEDIDGFPMMIEMDLPGMPVSVQLEVINIEFGKINKKEFEKPKGYEVKPYSAMNPF